MVGLSSGAEDNSKTIVFVSLARGLGGSTRSLSTVLGGLEGRITRVLASPSDGTYLDFVRKHKQADFLLSLWDSGTGKNGRAKRFGAAVRLVRWCRKNRERIVAIHANGPEEVNLAAPAALFGGLPLVVWIHAFEVSPWQRRLGPVWRRLLARHDVRWAAVSNVAARVLAGTGMADVDDVLIVPNPIDPADVLSQGRKPSRRLTVGFIGTAEERKGWPIMPEVVDSLSDLDIHWMFYTNEYSRDRVKQQPVWARLRSLSSDRVTFAGKVEDIREAYAQVDVVVCPSTKESFCRVAAEAMINGIPVVASDLEPLQELVGNANAGLLFPTGDVQAAADAIRRLAVDSDLRHRLGRNGVRRASVFSPTEVVNSLSALYGLEAADKKALSDNATYA